MTSSTLGVWMVLGALALGCGSNDSTAFTKATGGSAGTATGGAGASGGAAGASAGGTTSGGAGGTTSGGAGGTTSGGAAGTTSGGAGGTMGGTGGTAGGTGGGSSCPSATPGACGDDGTSWPIASQSLECQAIDILNKKRAAGFTCGTTDMPPVGALTRDQVLTANGRAHSQDMAVNKYFDLTTPSGTSAMDWSMAGYCGKYVTAEIGGGQADPNTFVMEQLNIPTECTKLMAAGAKGVGVGYYTDATGQSDHMWTMIVGNKP